VKKTIISGAVVILLGLLIAFGPQLLFKLCGGGCGCCGDTPTCHWTGQAELGIGMLIAALGVCMLVFTEWNTQFGLIIGVFFAGIIALLIPHALIGGCAEKTMACHRIAFPALTIESVILVIFAAVIAVYGERKKPSAA